jgi:hypothetical protein
MVILNCCRGFRGLQLSNWGEKIKLPMEYENVSQKVLLLLESTFWITIFIFRKQYYFVFPGLNIIGHRNPDNNLESLYTFSA